MKVSVKWLKDWLPDLDHSAEVISDRLTAMGLEVEDITLSGPNLAQLKDLIVGFVEETSIHPDASKLKITRVNVGEYGIKTIVCGANNIATGQKVVVALPGVTIYPTGKSPLTLSETSIRGQLSQGMICAEDEIGLGTNHDGILILDENAVIGASIASLYEAEQDTIIEIGLTPNRVDAASHLGVARDLSAGLGLALKDEKHADITLSKRGFGIKVEEGCASRYELLLLKNIKVIPSPQWLRDRLESIGQSSINLIVDLTNYILQDLGQPLHAFDFDKINGDVLQVRMAKEAEMIETLDGKKRSLYPTDLVIADVKGPVALAGTFGGLDSGVSEQTTSIILESACFNPILVRGTAKRHDLHTEASYRFERGVDVNLAGIATQKFLELLKAELPDLVVEAYSSYYPNPTEGINITFNPHWANGVIGEAFSHETLHNALINLGMKLDVLDDEKWIVQVPTYKVDVNRPIDLVEEILRIEGFDKINVPKKVTALVGKDPILEKWNARMNSARKLVSLGYAQTYSWSFGNKSTNYNAHAQILLVNPMSPDMDVMRDNLIEPLLESAKYNFNRGQSGMRLFTIAKTYGFVKDGIEETETLAILISGSRNEQNFNNPKKESTFDHLKLDVLTLLPSLVDEVLEEDEYEGLVIAGKYKADIILGQVSPGRCEELGLSDTFYAQIPLQHLKAQAPKEIKLPSKFPGSSLDLSILLPKNTQYASLINETKPLEVEFVKQVELFDLYQPKEGDKISYGLRFYVENDKATLSDKEIASTLENLLTRFRKVDGAQVRES